MPHRKRNVKQDEIVKAFAERLKALRAARDMTQKDLASKAHITLSYVSRLEAAGAAPGIDLLKRLAEALEVEVTELLPAPEVKGASREEVKKAFDALLPKAGPETLSMLMALLSRLADSSTSRR
jgi:transcriptional regulator with XRE-family HTH domain